MNGWTMKRGEDTRGTEGQMEERRREGQDNVRQDIKRGEAGDRTNWCCAGLTTCQGALCGLRVQMDMGGGSRTQSWFCQNWVHTPGRGEVLRDIFIFLFRTLILVNETHVNTGRVYL